MILDELDSGVGGRLGRPVAAMLRRMAAAPGGGEGGGGGAAAQILCVSHLPQVRAQLRVSVRAQLVHRVRAQVSSG